MIVIYAEKASLAKAIAAALKAGNRIAHPKEPTIGHYEFTFNGEKIILCHGVGHLCGLVDAKVYGEQYAVWNTDNFPCIPDSYQIAVNTDTKTCFDYVKGFFDKADLIINATDPDREGELIFAYIYEAMHCTKKWKRVWIEDLTPQKIQYAFAHLKDSSEVISIQQAGRARGIADWLCGINLTIAATGKYSADPKNMFRIGRVQTPVLAMVVEREKKIKGHIRTPFWRLLAEFQTDNGSFTAEYEKGILDNEHQAKSLLSKCVGNGTVTAKTVKKRTVGQPVLYNATQLQATAGKKLGWDLDKTVKVMQDLYEHKFMSYPRTSSEHLTIAMQPEVTATLRKLFLLPEYSQYALPENEWQAYSKRHFDDNKVDSHPAIVPTMNVPKSLSEILSEDERQLYDLLVKSLIRIVYPKAEIEDTTVSLDVNGNTFKATGSIITNNGWYAVDALSEKTGLPPVSEGESYSGRYELKQGFTEPPKPYTEADLIMAMETAGKHLEDEEARALMKAENKGLGTPATRAGIINALFHNSYLTKNGKSIMPTAKGIFLIDHLPIEELKSPEMTGQWEKRLHDIADGKADYNSFITAMEQTVRDWYSAVVSSADTEKYVSDEATLSCPFCGAKIIKGKFGYFCSAKKDTGCSFSVGNEICGKAISDGQAIRLIEKGKTTLIKGFKKKDGSGEFDAYLVVDKTANRICFSFTKKDTQ